MFYGDSEDFGRAELEDIQAAIENHQVYTNKYCTHDISTKYNFKYKQGSEIIDLKQTN